MIRHLLPGAAALALLVGAATPAVAAPQYAVAYTGGDGVALRSAPLANARLSPLVYWRDGTPVQIVCQAWSSDGVGPRVNHVFDQVVYPVRSTPTWIPDAYVSGTAAANRFTPGVPRCGTAPAPTPAPSPVMRITGADAAIGWMTTRSGSRQFDGLCLDAVHRAYLATGRDITAGLPYGPAHDSAYSFWSVARGRHPGDRNPPRGALVFFRSAAGAPGHVAIALGDGRMVSTWDGRTAGIHTMLISSYDPSRYLGWATP